MLKRWPVLVLAILIGSATYWLLFRPTLVPTVKVAFVVPRTGQDERSGRDLLQGLNVARMRIAEQELLTHGFRLVFEEFDDQSTPEGAQSVAHRIVADPRIVAVIGHFSSATTVAALPIYEDAGLPVLMPIATLTSITSRPVHFAFRMPPNNDRQAETVVAFLREHLHAARVFLAHDDTAYGQSLAATIGDFLKNSGMVTIGRQEIPRGTENFLSLATQLRTLSKPVDAVVYVGYSREAVFLATQLGELEKVATHLVLTDGAYGSRYLENRGSESSFVVYQCPPDDVLSRRPEWESYRRGFLAAPNRALTDLKGWSVWGYDAALLMRHALNQSLHVSRVPRASLLRSVLAGKVDGTPFLFSGAVSDFQFDARGENQHGYYYVYTVKDNQYLAVNWRALSDKNANAN